MLENQWQMVPFAIVFCKNDKPRETQDLLGLSLSNGSKYLSIMLSCTRETNKNNKFFKVQKIKKWTITDCKALNYKHISIFKK